MNKTSIKRLAALEAEIDDVILEPIRDAIVSDLADCMYRHVVKATPSQRSAIGKQISSGVVPFEIIPECNGIFASHGLRLQ